MYVPRMENVTTKTNITIEKFRRGVRTIVTAVTIARNPGDLDNMRKGL
jgi:hypothetical protein